jgi:hypothetical protein
MNRPEPQTVVPNGLKGSARSRFPDSSATRVGIRSLLVAAAIGAAALLAAACGLSTVTPTGIGAGGSPGGSASSPAGAAAEKDITNFDACSVVSESEYVQAITAGASDPNALGTINATHAPVDASNTGLPGAKACKLSYTTTDSAGRQSQGGDPVIVTFDKYSNLAQLQGTSPKAVNDYASAGAQAFEGPGSPSPYITKDGYLFYLSGNSDSTLLKTITLGICTRL